MMTLSDHSYGRNPHEPYVAEPHWDGTEIDVHGNGELSASSMVSDFKSDGSRKIAWHTGPNPCMAVYYPVIFHHDGHVSEMGDFLTSGEAWHGFKYSIYSLAGYSHKRIKYIQDTWRPIQQRFFEQAEEAAEKAEKMELVAADAMLTGVLLNISTTIRQTLVDFNRTWGAEM